MKSVLRALLVVVWSGLALAGRAQAADDKAWSADVALGRADAPVTIIEYASLTCPHCADFAERTLPQFKRDWIDTGKVRLIYRDFPLDGRALAAAMVSHCAGSDRYFAFLDTFYASQKTWAQADDFKTALGNIARLGGLSPDKVEACLNDRGLMEQIQLRKQDGSDRYGIDSTPSFIVNGKKASSGFLSYEQLVRLVQ